MRVFLMILLVVSMPVAHALSGATLGEATLDFAPGPGEVDEKDLILSTSVEDGGGDETLICDWQRDGGSFASLIMPFAAGIVDYSSNQDHGTNNGVVFDSTAGHDGLGALVFDGSTRFISLSKQYNFTSFTAAAWVKPNLGGDITILGSTNNHLGYWWGIHPNGDGTLYLGGLTDGHDAYRFIDYNLVDGEWAHLAITWDAANGFKAYKNGVLVGTQTTGISSVLWSNHPSYGINIGTIRAINPLLPFNGVLDELMIFEEELSEEQINNIYANGHILSHEQTTLGETWHVDLTLADQGGVLDTLTSNVLTISQDPSIENAQLQLSSNGDLEIETTLLNTLGDETLVYDWQRDGSSFASLLMPFASGIIDYSSNQDHGVNNGVVFSPTGGHDALGGVEFDGATKFISLDKQYDFSSFTAAAWVRPNLGSDITILGSTNNHLGYWWGIHPNGDGTLYLGGLTDGHDAYRFIDYNLVDGQWAHIAVTWDAVNGFKAYKNGQLVGTQTTGITNVLWSNHPSHSINIGTIRAISPLLPFDGGLDELMIFEEELSGEQIQNLYSGTPTLSNQDIENGETWDVDISLVDQTAILDSQTTNSITIGAAQQPQTLNLVYDNNGNLISGDGFFRTYNGFNQLKYVYQGDDDSGNLLQELAYHPVEERVIVKKVYDQETLKETTIYHDENFVTILNDTGRFDYTYVYHEGQQVVQMDHQGNKEFIFTDHLGSSSAVVDFTGAVIEQTTYEPFGAIASGGEKTRYDYEGKEFDAQTGEYDFHFRKFSPGLGIFTQPDSLIPNTYDPQSLNRYMFERGNTYKHTDPTGHCIWDACVAEVTFVLAIAGIAGTIYGGYKLARELNELEEQQGELKATDYALTAARILTIASAGLFFETSKITSALSFGGRQGAGFLGSSHFENKATKIHYNNVQKHIQSNANLEQQSRKNIEESVQNTRRSKEDVRWYYNEEGGTYQYWVGEGRPSNRNYEEITADSI